MNLANRPETPGTQLSLVNHGVGAENVPKNSVVTVCDDCYRRNGGGAPSGNVLASLLPTSRFQNEKKFGMSFQRNQRTCSFDECPLCSNQANYRAQPLAPEDDPDFIQRVQDPYDICDTDRGLVPPSCAVDSSKFNSAVLVFVWLMIAFWISMMVLTTFDDRAYLAVGRQGLGAGLGTYFSGASRNAGLFGSDTRNDVFSVICIVVCVLNVVMVLNRMMACPSLPPSMPGSMPGPMPGPQGPQGFQGPQGSLDSVGNVPMGMRAFSMNNQVFPDPNPNPDPDPPAKGPHAVQEERDERAVIRSSQFLAEPEEEESSSLSNASSFPNYGPDSLRMDTIVKQKGARLSQCGDFPEDFSNALRSRRPPMHFGPRNGNKVYEQSFGQKFREVLRKRPSFPLLKAPDSQGKQEGGAIRAKSVKESQPPVLGRGKPVTDKDMDLIGWRANKSNDCYVPANRSVFLTKTNRKDLSGEGGHFLGRLRTSPEDDPNEGSEVSIMERWKAAARASGHLKPLAC